MRAAHKARAKWVTQSLESYATEVMLLESLLDDTNVVMLTSAHIQVSVYE